MPNVTIISIWSKRHRNDPPVRYDVSAQGDTVNATLERAFALTNVDNRPLALQVDATTTGDIMLLDGKHYLVEDQGFHELTEAEAQRIEHLGSEVTSKGYDWLVREHLL